MAARAGVHLYVPLRALSVGDVRQRHPYAVAYDFNCGELRAPAAKTKEEESPPPGDCVDCSLVQVCSSVGIDIRDVFAIPVHHSVLCASTPDPRWKIDLPKGLIRYATEEERWEGGKRTWCAHA